MGGVSTKTPVRWIGTCKHSICLYKYSLLGEFPLIPPPFGVIKRGGFLRNRKNGVLIYLTESEKKHLTKQAERARLNNSVFIRKLISGTELRSRPPDEYGKIIRELSAIGNNVNQIARVANSLGKINYHELEKIQAALDNIWREVKNM